MTASADPPPAAAAPSASPASASSAGRGGPGAPADPADPVIRRAFDALRAADRGDVVEDVARRAKAMLARPVTIVVVGELGRGKSSVVNALLGAPGFAPVGERETTTLPVSFLPASEDLEHGAARLVFVAPDGRGTREERMPVAGIADWVAAEGRMADSDEASLLRRVEVGVRCEALPGVVVVDTPGSGGLSLAHARRALRSAERAGVLLVVADASGRVTRDALRFLERAVALAGHVVVVMNKTDQNRQWRRIAEENRRILRDAMGGEPPAIVGASALAAERAARLGGSEAERLLAFSGIPELRDALRAPLARADRLPRLATLRRLVAPLERVIAEAELEIAAAEGDPAELAALEERRRALADFQEDSRAWQLRLKESISDVGKRVRREALALVDAFGARWGDRLREGAFGVSKARSAALRAEIRAEILDIEDELRDRLARGVGEGARQLFGLIGEEAPEGLATPSFAAAPAEPELKEGPSNLWETIGMAGRGAAPGRLLLVGGGSVVGASAATSAGAGVGASAAIAVGATGGVLLAAGLAGGVLVAARLRNRAQAQRVLADSLRDLRAHVDALVSDAVDHLDIAVRDGFELALRRRTALLSGLVAEGERARQRSVPERQASARAARARAASAGAALEAVRGERERLARELAAGGAPTAEEDDD